MKLGKSSVQWSNYEFRGDILSKEGTTLKKKTDSLLLLIYQIYFMFSEI